MAEAVAQLDFELPPHADVARGVFETVLVADGRAVDSARHLARLATSLHDLYGRPLPGSLNDRIADAARGRMLARLRVDVGPKDGDEGEIRVEDLDPARVLPERECELVTVSVAAGFGEHKLADRGWLEQIEARAGAGAAALLVTRRGELLESTRASVFLLRGGVAATPPLERAILPGVTRAVLLERARRAGLPAHELPLTLADLRDADAVLLVSSLRRIECARGRDGERSRELLTRLRAELAP